MSGTDLAIRARKEKPDIGVVFATGHSDLPALTVGRPAVLLQKPYDAKEIAAALAATGV